MSVMLEHISPKNTQSAWVVFTGQTELKWLRILKAGYRHCYVLINDGEHWISLDPLSGYTEIMVHHIAPAFDLPGWLRSHGLKVVDAPMKQPGCQSPCLVYSCVEAVKRVLGMHEWWIVTPWQLYRNLSRQAVMSAMNNHQTITPLN